MASTTDSLEQTISATDDSVRHVPRQDHDDPLLDALMQHRGPAVLSGYANSLYDDTLTDWKRVVMKAPKVEKGAYRAEVIWIKPA